MTDHRGLSTLVLSTAFLLPALILLFFSWSVRIPNTPAPTQRWRRETYKWGLVAASASTAWFLVSCLNYIKTGEPATGLWLSMNRMGFSLWVAGAAASLAGKGSGRILLFCWSIMLFLGVLGLDMAMTP
jgi:hypothetical protein